ncbi:MAG: winged helix-turn-helix transcriptional regulator [Solirubrobacteraceae bacterium]|nr:winged helix-turn-helix transcriptional regulator [Solirubrobacteraceae bacterium]
MATEEKTAAAAWSLVWQIFQSDKPRRWGLLAEHGLTPVQGMALSSLDADDPPTMSQLSGLIMCDSSTLTGVVDRLEAVGIVERRPAPNDRRARCVALTEHGREVQARLRAAMAPPPPVLEHLTSEEAAQLYDLLATALEREAAAS